MADYYFDGLNGSPNNTGGPTSPFLNFQDWENVGQPGDKLIVRHGRIAGHKFTKPVQVVADGAVSVFPAVGMVNCFRFDFSENRQYKGVGGNLIRGFTLEYASQANIFAVLCDGLEIVGNEALKAGVWNIHVGGCDAVSIRENRLYWSVAQHNCYVANSCDDVRVVNNKAWYAGDMGFHFNGDIGMSKAMGLIPLVDNPDGKRWDGRPGGYISRLLCEGNRVYKPALLDSRGGGMDGDGVLDAIYRDNWVMDSYSWGFNVFNYDGSPSKNVLTENNRIWSRSTCVNIGNVQNLTLRGNTFATAGNGGWIDNTAAGAFADEGNTFANTSPFTAADLAEYESAYDVPTLPPPPPPPPPETVPPLPDAAPALVASDVTLIDLANRGAYTREWDNRQTHGTDGWVAAGLSPVPVNGGEYATSPLAGVGRENYGVRWQWIFRCMASGVYRFWVHGNAQFDLWAGPPGNDVLVLSGTGRQSASVIKSGELTLEAGKFYAFDAGLSAVGDTVGMFRLSLQGPDNPTTKEEFPQPLCYPPVLRPVPGGVSPPPPPNVPPPLPGGGLAVTFTNDQLAGMERLGIIPKKDV